jgi:hypothetical protein
LSFYTLILTGLYAAIPYKTPWCLLSFLHGMILLAGIGTWAWLRLLPSWPIKFLASLLLVGWLFPLGLQCYTFNYKFPADPRNPYVYAQTPSDTVKLANFVERLALVSPQGHNMVIHVVTPENCWPLPWYFRQFPNVGYPRPGFWMDVKEWNQWRLANRVPPPSLILLSENVPEEVEQYLQGHFSSGGSRGLRPGVVLQINVRQDLWETFAEANK